MPCCHCRPWPPSRQGLPLRLHGCHAAKLLPLAPKQAGKKDVLIATDVASKGLDFEGIQHVINYDMPEEIENYVHRIGRTGGWCGGLGRQGSVHGWVIAWGRRGGQHGQSEGE